jgi:hypothetical protein
LLKSKDILPLFFLLFTGLILYLSMDYPWQAAALPIFFGSIVVLLLFAQLIIEKNARLNKHLGFLVQSSGPDTSEHNEDTPLMNAQEFWLIAWLILAAVLLYFFHFVIALVAYLFCFLKFQSKSSWLSSIWITLITTGFIYVLFVVILRIQL